ncbi:MAG TPA: arsenosugar biosynthesis radical SAM (seleno)protein ArsS [Geobacterales bacterium]|nr:arsenosugar biosynthesis radical SAM (seleno)protein ArsS [Geobacterales bacterium]
MTQPFAQRLSALDPTFVTFDTLRTLQVNLGDLCNLSCSHCHLEASSKGSRVMGWGVMERIIAYLKQHPGLTLDITGGAPEMNPHFADFVAATREVAPRRLVRTNLAIMGEQGFHWLAEFFQQQRVVLIASLPCYLEENVDRQRGKGVFRRSIAALQLLNTLGFGRDLELNLVYNPGSDFLPGSQAELEEAYRRELQERYSIVFNSLYTITNAPIGRFGHQLAERGRLERYQNLLSERFNPAAAGSIMCRTLVSVDWQGHLYNCDFNQAVDLRLTNVDGSPCSIDDLERVAVSGMPLVLDQHCYCCTAGEGSSCSGALAA